MGEKGGGEEWMKEIEEAWEEQRERGGIMEKGMSEWISQGEGKENRSQGEG